MRLFLLTYSFLKFEHEINNQLSLELTLFDWTPVPYYSKLYKDVQLGWSKTIRRDANTIWDGPDLDVSDNKDDFRHHKIYCWPLKPIIRNFHFLQRCVIVFLFSTSHQIFHVSASQRAHRKMSILTFMHVLVCIPARSSGLVRLFACGQWLFYWLLCSHASLWLSGTSITRMHVQ